MTLPGMLIQNAAPPLGRADAHRAAVALGDLADDRQAEPEPGIVRDSSER